MPCSDVGEVGSSSADQFRATPTDVYFGPLLIWRRQRTVFHRVKPVMRCWWCVCKGIRIKRLAEKKPRDKTSRRKKLHGMGAQIRVLSHLSCRISLVVRVVIIKWNSVAELRPQTLVGRTYYFASVLYFCNLLNLSHELSKFAQRPPGKSITEAWFYVEVD